MIYVGFFILVSFVSLHRFPVS